MPCYCNGGTLQFSKQIFNHDSLEEDNKLTIDNVITTTKPNPNPVFFSPQKTYLDQQQNHPFFTYEKAYKAIDLIALSYALFHTYKRYQSVYYEANSANQSYISRLFSTIVSTFSPQLLIDLSKNGSFLLESMSVLIETLVLKTSLKLILYAGQGDIIDLANKNINPGLKTYKLNANGMEEYVL
jgi:hypothetical protein